MYPKGGVVSIQADPADGYRFDRWTGEVADYGSSSTTVKMVNSKTVTAYFVAGNIAGDVDNNGTVNITDAILALQILSETVPADATVSKLADANGDGKISIEDIIYILRSVLSTDKRK